MFKKSIFTALLGKKKSRPNCGKKGNLRTNTAYALHIKDSKLNSSVFPELRYQNARMAPMIKPTTSNGKGIEPSSHDIKCLKARAESPGFSSFFRYMATTSVKPTGLLKKKNKKKKKKKTKNRHDKIKKKNLSLRCDKMINFKYLRCVSGICRVVKLSKYDCCK